MKATRCICICESAACMATQYTTTTQWNVVVPLTKIVNSVYGTCDNMRNTLRPNETAMPCIFSMYSGSYHYKNIYQANRSHSIDDCDVHRTTDYVLHRRTSRIKHETWQLAVTCVCCVCDENQQQQIISTKIMVYGTGCTKHTALHSCISYGKQEIYLDSRKLCVRSVRGAAKSWTERNEFDVIYKQSSKETKHTHTKRKCNCATNEEAALGWHRSSYTEQSGTL